ncbi:MAG: germination protein, Ger(x)C family, partial [Firmicutes bacterium]|nr:germination protein, Ger(x)C family [Bacillota bacterium]
YYLRPAFQSNKEYENYKWNEKYSQAEVNIEVKTQIRRTGLMLRTFPTE